MISENKKVTTMDISLLEPEERASKLLRFDETKASLNALADQSKRITQITNEAGRDECHSAYMLLKTSRVSIEKSGKEARDDANKFSKAVIAKERELVNVIKPEEERLQLIRDEWDNAKERVRLQAMEEERLRVEGIQERIQKMRELPRAFYGKPSEGIEIKLNALREMVIDPSIYEEYLPQMQDAHKAAMFSLADMLERQRAHEAEQERVRKQDEDNAILRAELEQAKRAAQEAMDRERERAAELDRIARHAREKEEAEERARERAIREAEEAKQRDAEVKRRHELDAQAEANRIEAMRLDVERISSMSLNAAVESVVRYFRGIPQSPMVVHDLIRVWDARASKSP